jgi:cytochrome c553
MDSQQTSLTKKRGPKPTGQGHVVGVRLHPEQLAQLDAWIAAQPLPAPSRPEAVRQLLEKGMATE